MSITKLSRKYGLSKSTLWHHIKNIKLDESVERRLRSRQGISKKQSRLDWDHAQTEAFLILENIDLEKAWPILYAALYWSEGTKSSFVFTNTDSRMIQVFLMILRKYLGVPNESLDFMIRTSVPMDPIACRRYWSEVASVPLRSIHIHHDDKHNKGKSQYGMCRITLRKGGYHLKLVYCLTRSVADKMLTSGSRSSTARTSHS